MEEEELYIKGVGITRKDTGNILYLYISDELLALNTYKFIMEDIRLEFNDREPYMKAELTVYFLGSNKKTLFDIAKMGCNYENLSLLYKKEITKVGIMYKAKTGERSYFPNLWNVVF